MAEERDFDKLWNYDDPSGTEKKFRELLPNAEKGKDKEYYLELMTQIARTNSLQMKFDEAHEILDKVMKQLKPEYITARIRFMLERGRTYNSSKVFDKARELFLAAYMQADKYEEDNLAIDAVHMLGIVDKGEESLKWNELAIQMAEDTEDGKAKGWLGSLYNNTGWTLHDMKEYDKAMVLFEKQVLFYSKKDNKRLMAISKWCVARCLRSMQKTALALTQQLELKDWMEKEGLERDGYNSEEIGECMLELGRKDEAKPYFKKAYEALSQDIWLAENEKERLTRLKELSE